MPFGDIRGWAWIVAMLARAAEGSLVNSMIAPAEVVKIAMRSPLARASRTNRLDAILAWLKSPAGVLRSSKRRAIQRPVEELAGGAMVWGLGGGETTLGFAADGGLKDVEGFTL